MEKKAVKSAWLIVDLVNDFVTGKFGSEKGIQVAERTAEILEDLEGKITVIFTLDTHVPGDPEFSVWGEHCLIGTDGSQLYPKLQSMKGYSITKRHYDAFLGTDLDLYLRMSSIQHLYISGISTDICVLHTAAGAFFHYYGITVISDLCTSIDPNDHESAIKFMQRYYGANIIDESGFRREVI